MLKLKLNYFGHLMQRTVSLEKILMLGKIEGERRKGSQRMRWLEGVTDSMDLSLSKFRVGQKSLVCYSPWGCKESDMIEWLKWIMSDVEHLVMCFWPSDVFFGKNVCLGLLPTFWFGCLFLCLLNCMNCVCILEINSLSVALFTDIISHSEGCLFILLISSFIGQKL